MEDDENKYEKKITLISKINYESICFPYNIIYLKNKKDKDK